MREGVSDEEFVKEWINAVKNVTGLKELAKKLGMEYVKVSQRATSLRTAGVKLPTMPKKAAKNNYMTVDVDKLNGMIVKEFGEQSLYWRNR